MAKQEYKVTFYEQASYEIHVEADNPKEAEKIVQNGDWKGKPRCTGIHDRGVTDVEKT